jgi:Helix-turn-helix of DDE superfamily endonuclease
MNVETALQKESQFLAATSLKPAEFTLLLSHFAPICEKYLRCYTLEGVRRKHIRYKEHGSSSLKGSDTKLFFLLYYLKNNSLQSVIGLNFEVSQSKTSRIIPVLLDLLNQTLAQMGLLPVRDGALLSERLSEHKTKIFSYDGTERPIQRNSDYGVQEEEFSGKKKVIM